MTLEIPETPEDSPSNLTLNRKLLVVPHLQRLESAVGSNFQHLKNNIGNFSGDRSFESHVNDQCDSGEHHPVE